MRVAAVIVTRNRLALLQTCLAAVRQQTRAPNRIIVVDNASTDGTSEWLAGQRDLTVITQPNCGSAGAYHTGLAAAMAGTDEWIWCMDDDGLPEVTALEELERQAQQQGLLMVGPLVVSLDDPTLLAFGPHGHHRVADVVRLASGPVLNGHLDLFNGALIHRRVIDTIGNVKREMFFWGEEYEYLLRARRHGIAMGTALTARHFHPLNRRSTRRLLGGWLGAVEIAPPNREPFFFRNLGYIQATYDGWPAVVRSLTKYTAYFLAFDHLNLKGACRFWHHYLAGAFDRYPGALRGADAAPHPLRTPVQPRPR